MSRQKPWAWEINFNRTAGTNMTRHAPGYLRRKRSSTVLPLAKSGTLVFAPLLVLEFSPSLTLLARH
jgi:hypothetical protein